MSNRPPRPKRATLPGDDIQVRAFMLADHAAQEQNGKLYINGGAIEWIGMPQGADRLPSLWLVIRLGVPWRLTTGGHVIEVRVLDQDRKPVGADPLARADAAMGRPPGAQPGDEFGLNLVLPIGGFPVTAAPDSTIVFHLSVDDREVATLPFKLKRIVAVPGMIR